MKNIVLVKDGAHSMTQKIRKDFLGFLIVMGTVISKRRTIDLFVHLKQRKFPVRRSRYLMLEDHLSLGFWDPSKDTNPDMCSKLPETVTK